jgi:YVTN family beta-propeller protein
LTDSLGRRTQGSTHPWTALAIVSLVGILLLAPLAAGTQHFLPSTLPSAALTGSALGSGRAHPLTGPTIGLSPTSGDVGSTLAARGTGFSPNSSILLSYGGTHVATGCSTDPNGTFPGVSGSNCSFIVPAAPGGNESVTAWDGGTPISGIRVGTDPYTVVYDPNKSEMFIVNEASDNVSVLSASTYAVLGAVAVGSSPENAVFDPASGELFVVNVGSDSVSVISDSNNTVVATVPVGLTPAGIAYDSGRGAVFVANSNSDNVSVISGRNNSLLASVSVGTSPRGLAYDSGAGEVFVADYGSDNVSVVDDSNDSVVANVTVGTSPSLGILYDPGANEVFVANSGSSNVSVISDSTDLVVATVPVGTDPDGIAYDRGQSEIFVTNYNSDNVTILSDRTNAAVANVRVGTGPSYGISYDSQAGTVFVPNSLSRNVSVIADTTNTLVATVAAGNTPYGISYDPGQRTMVVANLLSKNVSVLSAGNGAITNFVENSTLALIPTNGTVGSKVAASGTGFPASSSISFSFGGVSVTSKCSTDATGSFPGTSKTACTFSVPSNAGPSNRVVATSGTDSAAAVYTVPSGLVVTPTNGLVGSTVSATGVRFASNASITLTFDGATATSGCVTNSTGAFSGVTDSACAFRVPASPKGPETISASDGTHAATVSFTVNSNLTLSPSSGAVGVTAAATGSGFAASTTITFSIDNVARTSNCTSDASGSFPGTSGTACTFSVPSVPGGSEAVVATDGSNHTTAYFSVDSGLALFNSTGSADVAQKVTLEGSGYGDSLAISTFTLGTIALNCTSATTGTCTAGSLVTSSFGILVATFLVPSVPSSGSYNITMTDSAGHAGYTSITIYVDPDVATPTATVNSIDLGQSVTFATLASFGTGSYTYDWHGLPSGCGGNDSSVVCTPNATGTSTVTVHVTDTSGYSVTSGGLRYTVYPDPNVTTPGSSIPSGQVDGGQNVTFSTIASLGTKNYTTFNWSGLPTGCVGSTDQVACDGAALPSGNYTITVSVTDSNNVTTTALGNLSFVVDPDLTVTELASTAASVDIGQNVTFSAMVSQGSGGYTYAWTDLPTGCNATASAVVECNLTTRGNFTVSLEVTDSNGVARSSGSQNLTVFADPTLDLKADRYSFDAGQSVTLTAGAELGTGSYVYNWTGLPAGCVGTGASVTCAPTIPGGYSVTVQITDTDGVMALSSTVILVVSPPLTVDLSRTPSVATSGVSVTFTSTVHGGTGKSAYAWNFGDGTAATGASTTHIYTTPGAYSVWLWVNDTGGGSVKEYLNVTILTPAGSATPAVAALGPFAVALAVIVVMIVLAALVVLLMIGKRKAAKTPRSKLPEEPADSSEWGSLPEDGDVAASIGRP